VYYGAISPVYYALKKINSLVQSYEINNATAGMIQYGRLGGGNNNKTYEIGDAKMRIENSRSRSRSIGLIGDVFRSSLGVPNRHHYLTKQIPAIRIETVGPDLCQSLI
jgi:hypothetical protein